MTVHLCDFDVLSFDCYGTMIDWEAGLLGAWRKATASSDAPSDQDLLAAFGELETTVQQESPDAPYPEILSRVYRRLSERFHLAFTEAGSALFSQSVADWPPFEDSPQALKDLQSRHRLVILSNVDRRSFAQSERRLGLKFDRVITAEEIGAYKPDDAMFASLISIVDREFGVPPNRILHVAQSLYHDHVPAKRAGLTTVWIRREKGRAPSQATPTPKENVTPDLVFDNLEELARKDAHEGVQ